MKWFVRHPNWTMLLGWLLMWASYKPIDAFYVQWIFNMSLHAPAHIDIHLLDIEIFMMDYIKLVYGSIVILITVWGLRLKRRSILWSLLHFVPAGSLVILWLKSKSKNI